MAQSTDNEEMAEKPVFSAAEEKIIQFICQTGTIGNIKWEDLQTLLIRRFNDVLLILPSQPDSRADDYVNDCEYIVNCIKTFSEPPFTLQRIAELLLEPSKHYRSKERYVFHFRKLVGNVTVGVSETMFDEMVENSFRAYELIVAKRKQLLIDRTDLPEQNKERGPTTHAPGRPCADQPAANVQRVNAGEQITADSSDDSSDEDLPPPPGAMEVESVP